MTGDSMFGSLIGVAVALVGAPVALRVPEDFDAGEQSVPVIEASISHIEVVTWMRGER